MNTIYTTLQQHLRDHEYKRGAFKGDAPADKWKRGMNHYRVASRGTAIAVRFWHTDILLAYPDGSFRIDCGGYEGHTTTRKAVNHALQQFGPSGPRRMWIGREMVKGKRTMVVQDTSGKAYRYYDNMRFGPEGQLTSTPMPFQGIRMDKLKTTNLACRLKESGFKAMFPLLVASMGDAPPTYGQYLSAVCPAGQRWVPQGGELIEVLGDADRADAWPVVVSRYGFDHEPYKNLYCPREPKQIWTTLMGVLKADMRETYETDVLFVQN